VQYGKGKNLEIRIALCHDAIHENGVAARKQGWIIDTFHALPNPAPEVSDVQSRSQSQAHSNEE
jgi:hypothetical protein